MKRSHALKAKALSLAGLLLFSTMPAWGAPAAVEHFQGVNIGSNVSMTLYGYLGFDGHAAPQGVEIAVFDQNGVLCGASGVDTENGGAFLLQVYGDDPTSAAVDEGARDGEPLTFKVFAGEQVGEIPQELLRFSSAGHKDPTSFPPHFEDKASYGMRVEASVALPY